MIKIFKIFPFIIFYLLICADLFSQDILRDKFEVDGLKFEITGERASLEYRHLFNTHVSPVWLVTFVNSNIYSKIGAPKEYFEPIIFKEDISRLKRYLQDKGYYHSIVDTTIQYNFSDKNVSLLVKILEGKRTIFDSTYYIGIDSLSEFTKNELFENSLLKVNTPFDKSLIENEKKRIQNLLFNSGFRKGKVDITLSRYTSGKNIITINIFPDENLKFGNITIENENKEIDDKVIIQQLEFKSGDIYNEELRQQSEMNLNQLGIFQNAQAQIPQSLDSIHFEIPVKLTLSSIKLRGIEPELIVNDEYGSLNSGAGIGYVDRNFFGNARFFQINLRLLIHSIQELDFNSAFKNGINEPSLLTKSDLNFSLTQPYFFSKRNSSNFTLILEHEKQKLYTLLTFRGKFGITSKFATYTYGFFDWYLESFNVEQVDPNVDIILFTGNRQKQFNSIFSFTIQRDKTDNLFSPSTGFFHSLTIEESGFLPKTFKNFSQGLPFSEYYKFNLNLRHYFDFSNSGSEILAFRLRGGSAYLYNKNNLTPVPPTRRFFLGGSNSLRAWRSRNLATFSNPELGGNTSFEFSTEFRHHFVSEKEKFAGLETSKYWGVGFLDFGNLWDKIKDVNYKEIAISGGFGFRYDTVIGPIRLDFAWRIYDPNSSDKNWIAQRKFFKESFGLVQIGIGHVF